MNSDRQLFEVHVYSDKTVILVDDKEIVQKMGGITIQSRGADQQRNEALCAQSAALSAEPVVEMG